MDRVAETSVSRGVIWTKNIHPMLIANVLTVQNNSIPFQSKGEALFERLFMI